MKTKIERATEIHRTMTPHQMALHIVELQDALELTNQRDELLDALSGLVDFIEIDDLNIDALALKIAKDAIAKTKGGSENHSPDIAKMVAHEGWQLVPVEPTIEMVQAATHSAVGFGTRAAYRAMLAAAPKPVADASYPDVAPK